eukprot:11189502-Lingulodinium_polyedra.AAC.1
MRCRCAAQGHRVPKAQATKRLASPGSPSRCLGSRAAGGQDERRASHATGQNTALENQIMPDTHRKGFH